MGPGDDMRDRRAKSVCLSVVKARRLAGQKRTRQLATGYHVVSKGV